MSIYIVLNGYRWDFQKEFKKDVWYFVTDAFHEKLSQKNLWNAYRKCDYDIAVSMRKGGKNEN